MKKILLPALLLSAAANAQFVAPYQQDAASINIYKQFQQPPSQAAPWVFWYWMQAGVSRAGITADLEAMKAAGIGGAYLMSIKSAPNPPLYQPKMEQLTPEWWGMVAFALQEADRLGLKLGMHVSDGFALAGGPWITPEQSMQKIVWSEKIIQGGSTFNDTLPSPENYKGYYKDIAVFAFPAPQGEGISTQDVKPVVTTSIPGTDASFLTQVNNTKTFGTNDSCWVQYAFEKAFTCRSITIRTGGNNYQAHRLIIEISDDGVHYRRAGRLQAPRHGWQDVDAPVTHAIEPVTAKYFRFIYSKAGSEPGAEDLDAAKWKPSLKLKGIELSAAPRINQYEGKNGIIWRIGQRTTAKQLSDALAVPAGKIINLTAQLDSKGRLNWKAPAGRWCILRMGHTSTGHTNATGGAGQGLECDKFDPAVVKVQFDHWFKEAFRQAGPVASRALKAFHVDSWECGSQNWSPVFRDEFRRRRGYDLLPYLPVIAGIPVQSVQRSEQVLYDVRQTIAELVKDNFYTTLSGLAHEQGCTFTAESVAPTMMSDGMLHYSQVDIPMGEFWLNSPTHDKPNDMMDAISGAHIYGKPIIQAESFTTLRMTWNEHPGMLKTIQDRNYALGVNKLVYHVFVHNPWTDRKPGMTLDGVGLYFQRDQTWWKPGAAWVDYARRCQALLQLGKPVADVAVFTGCELPRRAILPDRLVSTLPGIFGADRVQQEAKRLANQGEPLRVLPEGVTHSANMADPENWVDPLKGYTYDSFNEDALQLATPRNGRIVLPGGASYGVFVVPVADNRNPGNLAPLSATVKSKLAQWQQKGIKIIRTPYTAATFDGLGVARDLEVKEGNNYAKDIAWTHRAGNDFDIYFIANQQNAMRMLDVSLRVAGRVPEIWNPVTGDTMTAREWTIKGQRTTLPLQLVPNGSLFIVLQHTTSQQSSHAGKNWTVADTTLRLINPWQVTFDTAAGGPLAPVTITKLENWAINSNSAIRYYSGTARYETTFNWQPATDNASIRLALGKVANLAEVEVNGMPCGVAWTAPYTINISKAIKAGENKLVIKVTNTWANRLTGDLALPEQQRRTWTTAPLRLAGKPLQEAGLLGEVTIIKE